MTLDGWNVSEEELEQAARELDEKLYGQNFEASFEGALEGMTCYAFSRVDHVSKCDYVRKTALVWAIDFNVDPMCAVLAQCVDGVVYVLDEIVLRDANTPAACEEFLRKTAEWRKWETVGVAVYGDASGHQRRTCGSKTDWALIREFFGQYRGEFAATMRTTTQNPGVRDRVNVMNKVLRNAAGERRMVIDPKCRELIRDLERVSWRRERTGAVSGELDKTDRMCRHM